MKHKKALCLFLSFFAIARLFCASNSFSVSPVFLIHNLHAKVTRDDSKINDEYKRVIRSSSDDTYKDSAYGFGTSLDLNTDFLYFSFRFAFPTNFQTNFIKQTLSLLKGHSIITDLEIGLCYKTFEKKPYNLLFQIGLGFGVDHMNFESDSNIEENEKISYTKTDLMLGLGGNILFTYHFHKVVGLYVGIGDMFYFMNLKTYRLIKLKNEELLFEEKLKSENFNAINTFANSLVFKAGISFAF